MRGAVAEVEDYARVTVSTQSRAALAGSAVTDVIHLLAELIENATTLSPPFTQVRVGGESVGNGFAIEIEDRGLGMNPQRLAELNDRLANPPDINPANTEQLGLFVVGQLAKRHGIIVTLRPSPYGGTTAVAVVPRTLIVEDGPAALTTGGAGTSGAGAYYGGRADVDASAGAGAWAGSFADGTGGFGPSQGDVQVPPMRISGALRHPGSVTGGIPMGAAGPAAANPAAANPAAANPAAANPAAANPAAANPAAANPAAANPAAANPAAANPTAANPTAANPVVNAAAESAARRGRHGTGDVPVVAGVPVGRPTPSPAAPFDVFTPIQRPDQDVPAPADTGYGQAYPDFGSSASGLITSPAVSPANGGSYGGDGFGNGLGSYEATADGHATKSSDSDNDFKGLPRRNGLGNNGATVGGHATENSDSDNDFKGLPRRVRQANLAPELRASTAAGSHGPASVPPATAASLSDMRNTLSAMQRGWQEGRSQSQRDTEDNTVDGD